MIRGRFPLCRVSCPIQQPQPRRRVAPRVVANTQGATYLPWIVTKARRPCAAGSSTCTFGTGDNRMRLLTVLMTALAALIGTTAQAKTPILSGEVKLILWDADRADSNVPLILSCGDQQSTDRTRIEAKIDNPSLGDGYHPFFPEPCCDYYAEPASVMLSLSPSVGNAVTSEWRTGWSGMIEVRDVEGLVDLISQGASGSILEVQVTVAGLTRTRRYQVGESRSALCALGNSCGSDWLREQTCSQPDRTTEIANAVWNVIRPYLQYVAP